MSIGILATGDELIHGDTLDTNSHDIARYLSSEGLPLGLKITSSDKKNELITCLKFLALEHHIIILIGGLGPTTDDLTRFALAQLTDDPLIEHPQALAHLESLLAATKAPLNAGNLQQCLFPATAQLLPNPYGSAMGCMYHWQEKLFILLPGPPRECLPMFTNYVLPHLQNTAHSQKQILKWRIFGLPESYIGSILENALAHLNCQTGYRLETPYIEFKVRCPQEIIKQVKSIVDPILAPHIIAPPEKRASDLLRELILKLKEPITLIDEVTGGLLHTLLVKPGMHDLIRFNTLRPTRLYCHCKGLNEYWSQQAVGGNTQITIDYSNQRENKHETHLIPYNGHWVLPYAAEWLCFRLFQLINQLH